MPKVIYDRAMPRLPRVIQRQRKVIQAGCHGIPTAICCCACVKYTRSGRPSTLNKHESLVSRAIRSK